MPDTPAVLVRGGTVLTMDPTLGDLPRGDVLVRGSHIVAVGRDLAAEHRTQLDSGQVRQIDATGCLVVPGFVDTHRHMWEAIARGIAPEHTLADYLREVLGRLGPALGPADVALGTRLSADAALLSGITTVADLSNIQETAAHTDAIVAAHRTSGLRTVFAYGNSAPGARRRGGRLPEEVRRVRAELLADDTALVTMALDVGTGDDDTERHNAALVRELAVPVTRHVVGAASAPSRQRRLGVLAPGAVLIHATALDHDELAIAADADVALSIAPAIEMMMGHGYPALGPALGHPGLGLSLSTDVEVTVAADMFTQLRAGYQAARHAHLADPDAVAAPSARRMLELATIDGARALGLADRTGSLTPGKAADLVVLRADRPDVAPVFDPASTVTLQMDRAHVDTVLVAGTTLVRGGQLVRDATAAVEQAGRVRARLHATGVLRAARPGTLSITLDPRQPDRAAAEGTS